MSELSPEARVLIQRHLLSLEPLPPTSDVPPTSSTVRRLAEQLIAADFKSILLSEPAQTLLESSRRVSDYAPDLQDLWSSPQLVDHVAGADASPSLDRVPSGDDQLINLIIAIACLHAFVQTNWTGPDLAVLPADVLPWMSSKSQTSSHDDKTDVTAMKSTLNEALHSATIPLLAKDGEPAYHLARAPTFLLFALRILERLDRQEEEAVESVAWWLLRANLVHQSLLDEAVPLPEGLTERLTVLVERFPALFVNEDDQITSASSKESSSSSSDFIASLHLELGLAYHLIGSDRLASTSFAAAGRASGLEWELTGALGKRTRFQVKDLSQLVLLARSRERGGKGGTDAKEADVEVSKEENPADAEQAAPTAATTLPEALPLNDDTLLEETEFSRQQDPFLQSQLTDRLANLDPANQPALHPLDQSLLLSFCLSQHNTSPEHGLTASEMAPYLARVITHPRNWSVHTTALLLRARLESTRSRTVERSALQLQALIDQMPTSDSSTDERLKYFHQIPLPSRWEMENELARRYLGLGVVRSALEIFTRLEMWEEAVKCLVSMERTDQAIEVVKDLLEGRKAEIDIVTLRYKVDARESSSGSPKRKRARIDAAREAKLWCVLGDLEPEHGEERYKQAWEISKGTSSRSQRSLGALYVSQERFDEAVECFRKALKINPLYARTWFALGCSLVRLERWDEARDAFSRDVAIEEEDGEAWNNLAAVYLRISAKREEGTDSEQNEEGIPFANKRLAFLALQQGLRFSRENWRMWQNYMVVAVDVGELSEAARALSTIVGQRTGREASLAVDHAVLSKLVDAVTREPWNNGKGDENKEGPVTSNEGLALLPIVDRLFNVVILPRVSNDPRIYAIQARLYRWKEDWAAALECYMKVYRSGVANDEEIERDVKRFREAIEDLEELINIMQNLGPKAKEQEERLGLVKGKAKWNDWKFQARTLVRTFTGRVKDSFGDEPEFERLRLLMDEIKNA